MLTTILATVATVLSMGAHMHCNSMTDTQLMLDYAKETICFDIEEGEIYADCIGLEDGVLEHSIYTIADDVSIYSFQGVYNDIIESGLETVAEYDSEDRFVVYESLMLTKLYKACYVDRLERYLNNL